MTKLTGAVVTLRTAALNDLPDFQRMLATDEVRSWWGKNGWTDPAGDL